MTMKNEEFLQEFFIVNNHSEKTQKSYLRSINYYSKFTGLPMEELIEEAEEDENKNMLWKHRKLKKRLLNYRSHLIKKYKKNTAHQYFIQVKAVYKYYEIEIGDLTKPNPRSFNNPGKVTFDELITHEEISQVLHVSPLWFQALVLFQISSGCARKETVEMTIGSFIKATYSFHKQNDVIKALNILKDMNNVVPTFKLKREKTNKYYYTFCSPEAVSKIVEYLLTDRIKVTDDNEIMLVNLSPEDKLFTQAESYLPAAYHRMNTKLDLGKASDGFNRFRSHMMRKFHSNHLKKDGMSESDIDALQGRTKSSTRAAYFLEDPDILLKKYLDHFHCLLIESTVNSIDFKSPEFVKLESENSTLRNELGKMDDIMERLNKLEGRS